MSRVHLFEFEDQPWFPRTLRDAMTAMLDFWNQRNGGWDAFAPLCAKILRRAGSERIVDLGSGGGGPVLRMRRTLATTHGVDPSVLLTDKYPNRDAFAIAAADPSGRVACHTESVDATNVPADLEGVRTMFCSFHHFPPVAARRVLADARDKGRAIGIFETTTRSASAIAITLFAPVVVLGATPFIRPFRWSRVLFTYLIPVLPILCLWDGLVSCLRSYSGKELRAMTRALAADGYVWEVGEIRFPQTPFQVAYLLGWPESAQP